MKKLDVEQRASLLSQAGFVAIFCISQYCPVTNAQIDRICLFGKLMEQGIM